MSAPVRPDFVEVNTSRAEPRLHGRCPYCNELVSVLVPRDFDVCRGCERSFALLDILPLTKLTL